MADNNSFIPNSHEPSKPLACITFTNVTKLLPNNYPNWKQQVEALLDGYDLLKYPDGSFPAPSETISTAPTSSTTPPSETTPTTASLPVTTLNPAYQTWRRQDHLIYGALLTTLSNEVASLVSQTKTSHDLWILLKNTYAKASRSHLKQLKERLRTASKDMTDYVLHGLDDGYRAVIDGVNARDTPITFDDLLERLLIQELSIGHVLSECNTFWQQHPSVPPPPRNYPAYTRQVQVNTATVGRSQHDFLVDSGATHHVTNDLDNLALHHPYTGPDSLFMERRNRHIAETGLSLLHHSGLPLTYWPHAKTTAAYLINRLPTPILGNKHAHFNPPMVTTTPNPPEDSSTAPSSLSITNSPDMAQSFTEPTNLTQSSPPNSQSSSQLSAPLPQTSVNQNGGGIITRSKNNIIKLIQKLNLHVQASSPIEPNTITQALRDPDWRSAMQAEFDALHHNNTWDLVSRSSDQNLVGCTLWAEVSTLRLVYGASSIPALPWFCQLHCKCISLHLPKPGELSKLIATLAARFSLKDLGCLSYFLGVEVIPSAAGMFLSQRKYITDLLHKSGMANTKPAPTPLLASVQLLKDSGNLLPSPTEYRTLVGSNQYLSLTRPDIAFNTNKLAQFMQNPRMGHWSALKRVLRYLAGSCDKGVFISATAPLTFHAYSNADWAGDNDDYVSTTGYLLYLDNTPISWSSRKQRSVARSSTEAEYKALADTASELLWVLSLFTELGHMPTANPVIYCDNLGATNLSANLVFHSRMKHIALAYHFVREQVQHGKF
ncbi:hypothetical protein TSUD_14320 [Trifolium subterraneum]|uniref:Reverse transcriptase Ty1/copia-type domain-containing protein n=1 Tax=Trifolium subterraneum TaxID=3900 RepID=A0A2Z6PBT8_TRISU|nr:hypothetical protein TSUD_14320 [Trifolium subterraneum]